MSIPYLEVYCANTIAIVLSMITLFIARKKLVLPREEQRTIYLIGNLIIISAIIEPFLYYCEGKFTGFDRFVILIMNGYQYLAYTSIACLWLIYMIYHIQGEISKRAIILTVSPLIILTICVIINYFCPFIYKIDDLNTYHRLGGYYIFFLIDGAYLLSSVIIYFLIKKKRAGLLFFQAWLFVVPVFVGSILTTFIQYVSLIMPFCAIGLSAVIQSLQYEMIFKDRLTKIYNRSFLDYYMRIKSNKALLGIMIDINNFKNINDTFGHDIGDEALITFANVLNKTVGDNGAVIRYAGDEFIIFINSTKQEDGIKVLDQINENLVISKNKFNYPYNLSYSYGFSLFEPDSQSFDVFLNVIDKAMYENKRKFHQKNSKN